MVEQRCPVHTDAGCVVRLESLQLRCVLELALRASSALEQWSSKLLSCCRLDRMRFGETYSVVPELAGWMP